MSPDGPLTAWQILEVQGMINLSVDMAIKDYDGVNTARHSEHSTKMDRLMWGIIVTLASSVGTLITILLTHGK